MGTRAIVTLADSTTLERPLVIYQHWDGYPQGMAISVRNALPIAWPLPRFEADEFAAALLAGSKTEGGNLRVLGVGDWRELAPIDIEYAYVIAPGSDGRPYISGMAVSWYAHEWETKIAVPRTYLENFAAMEFVRAAAS